MKVLFAVSNEEISEKIVARYQKQFKQIISYKNVYYFNAILKEIQKDKSYDRIVISEDLEAYATTQYDQIDKFIFDKLDRISDEASNSKGDDIPIILIASDRREKSEGMLVKLFGIGLYNVLLGVDRSIEEVCKLINRPRLKKEAKLYYKIESENVKYQSENENDVTEIEIQNIIAYYKRIGQNEDKYVECFNNIAAQYNDIQLRIICKYLPLNVRAVLEEKSEKYQKVMAFNKSVSGNLKVNTEKKGPSEKLLVSKNKSQIKVGSVVIPSEVNTKTAKKLTRTKNTQVQQIEELEQIEENKEQGIPRKEITEKRNEIENEKEEEVVVVEPIKKKRGRPRKNPEPEEVVEQVKKKRGRPRKNPIQDEEEIEDEDSFRTKETVMPGFDDDENDNSSMIPGFEDEEEDDNSTMMSGFEDEEDEDDSTMIPGFEDEEDEDDSTMMPGFESEDNEVNTSESQNSNWSEANKEYVPINNMSSGVNTGYNNRNKDQYVETIDLSYLMSSDKKIVTFVGTSKNGTSFLVNNLAEMLSSMGLNTAILDTTQNRNSYYIYTKNEENLRNIATHSIVDLANGTANGIPVNKNLTVYTSMPSEGEEIVNVDKILETLLKKHSLILIDTDFETPVGYFKKSNETYLVQSLDILTIQPLTAFLRELKTKDILEPRKLRIVLNKTVKLRGINDKTIIGGMAFYNDPSMSYMTELFDRTLIKYMSIPFEEEIYTKYLENIVECTVSLKGYSKTFMQCLRELANMVYPVQGNYTPPTVNQGSNFKPSINNTLEQMRGRY